MTAELDRTEVLAGMHELVDFLAANPTIPVVGLNISRHGATLYPRNSPDGQDKEPALADLRAIAEAIGAEPFVLCSHVYADGPTFRGGVQFQVIVCDAAEDFARGVGKVADPDGRSGSATAPTESGTPGFDAAARLTPAELGIAPGQEAVPAPVATGDGAAVTPDVWVPRRRRGILYHLLDGQYGEHYSGCGRAVRPNGTRLPLAEATAFGAVPCPRCYAEQVSA